MCWYHHASPGHVDTQQKCPLSHRLVSAARRPCFPTRPLPTPLLPCPVQLKLQQGFPRATEAQKREHRWGEQVGVLETMAGAQPQALSSHDLSDRGCLRGSPHEIRAGQTLGLVCRSRSVPCKKSVCAVSPPSGSPDSSSSCGHQPALLARSELREHSGRLWRCARWLSEVLGHR